MPEQLRFPSSNGTDQVSTMIWTCEQPRAVVQICHGMAEHIMRYDEFARFLQQKGIVVCGNDHVGHGQTSSSDSYGYFAFREGWDCLVHDAHLLRKLMQNRYPDVPYILFGHSMGSMVARDYVARFGKGLRGAVFCGTSGRNPGAAFGKLLSRFLRPMEQSELLNKLAFGKYNERFDEDSEFAWLSSDAEQVSAYEADDMSGFVFTARGFHDLFDGLTRVSKRKCAKRMPKNMPILLIAGQDDPVGNYGKGVEQVRDKLRKAGCTRVTCILYKGMRHEILNEREKQLVYDDVNGWLETACRVWPKDQAKTD